MKISANTLNEVKNDFMAKITWIILVNRAWGT